MPPAATPEPRKNLKTGLCLYVNVKKKRGFGRAPTGARRSPIRRLAMLIVKSFDIFETLVARPFGSPQKVFPLVAASAKRNHNIFIETRLFERERVLAEKRARKK